MSGYKFKIPPKQVNYICPQCGEESRGVSPDEKCNQCRFYEDNPDLAPGYWVWTRTSGGWAAQARWRELAPEPQAGTKITVHRKDGNSSEHTVRELRSSHYDQAANRVVTVDVD